MSRKIEEGRRRACITFVSVRTVQTMRFASDKMHNCELTLTRTSESRGLAPRHLRASLARITRTIQVTEGPLPRFHPAPSRNEAAIVQPVLVKQLENDILTAVAFLPRWLAHRQQSRPRVKLWIRSSFAHFRRRRGKNGHSSRTAADTQDLGWVSWAAHWNAPPLFFGRLQAECLLGNLMYRMIYYRFVGGERPLFM
jgi:hypothetical protein